jgi:GNAT superfamily N-acetyltransferase
MVECREIEPGDAGLIARLHTLSWGNAYRGIISDDWLDNELAANRRNFWEERMHSQPEHSFGFIVLVDDDPAGFVFAIPGADSRWGTLIDNLHIIPGHKRQGLGRLLLARFAIRADELAADDGVYLTVYEENNSARRFYEAMGGVCKERMLTDLYDGGRAPILRYCWESPAALLAAVTR